MPEIKTEIEIDAPIEKIWQHLIAFKSYPNWNPFIKKIQGDLIVNNRLNVTIQPVNKKPMDFKPKIIANSHYTLRWLGHFILPGIFDGNHIFKLTPLKNGKVKFQNEENFTGILSWVIFKMLEKPTLAGFEQMNEALKTLCELQTATESLQTEGLSV